jgi:hypothetical protein
VEKQNSTLQQVWRQGADGKLERIATSVIQSEYKKLDRDIFALTFGHHDVPPKATRLSKKRQRLNYKQFSASLKRSGDMTLTSLMIDNTLPAIAFLLASPLAKYITLASNGCDYSKSATELIVYS